MTTNEPIGAPETAATADFTGAYAENRRWNFGIVTLPADTSPAYSISPEIAAALNFRDITRAPYCYRHLVLCMAGELRNHTTARSRAGMRFPFHSTGVTRREVARSVRRRRCLAQSLGREALVSAASLCPVAGR